MIVWLAACCPVQVEHVSWVEKVSNDVWAPVAADDVLILEHASWRLNNAATGTGARAEKFDKGIDQTPDEVFIDTGRTSVNLSRRIASSRCACCHVEFRLLQ